MKTTKVAASLVAMAMFGILASCDDSSSSNPASNKTTEDSTVGTNTDTGSNTNANTGSNTNTSPSSGGIDIVSTASIVLTGATTAKLIEHDTDAQCDENTLTVDVMNDTSVISIETSGGKEYIVTDDGLDTAIIGEKVVETSGRWTRKGSGSGFSGRWEPEVRVLSGISSASLPPSKMHVDSARIVIGSSSALMIAYGVHMGMVTGEMARNISKMPNLTTSVSSDSTTITMKSKSETVTLRYGFEGENLTSSWSSTNPNHASFVAYEEPKTCPDEDAPAWFDEFMANTVKGL